MTCFVTKATPINNINSKYHIKKHRTCLIDYSGFILCEWILIAWGWTHTHTLLSWIKAISRNQAKPGLIKLPPSLINMYYRTCPLFYKGFLLYSVIQLTSFFFMISYTSVTKAYRNKFIKIILTSPLLSSVYTIIMYIATLFKIYNVNCKLF